VYDQREEESTKVSQSIDIAADPAEVWPFLVEPEKVLQWCITFRKFEYCGEQRAGPGTPLYIEEDAGNGLTRMNFVVRDWKENERLDLQMLSGASYKSYEQHLLLEPTEDGSRFTYSEELVLPYGILGRAMGLIAERMSANTLHKMLFKLKELAEA
jgi:uncharacterized protein YndB with AHSA1/START domain